MVPKLRSRSWVSEGSKGNRRRWRRVLAAAVTVLVAGGLVAGITTLASAATTWTSVSAGLYHTCGIKSDKTLWCWGRNLNYQLGLGTTGTVKTPQEVGWSDWQRVDAGYHHTCGIKTNGWLYCWGYNGQFQAGGYPDTDVKVPSRVIIGDFSYDKQPKWTDIAAGDTHTCGIAAAVLYCWGANDRGQLGLGDRNVRTGPVKVKTGPWRDVDTGSEHTCAVNSDEAMYCWGFNTSGQLGLGYTHPEDVLKPQSQGGVWRSVTAGHSHTCGISEEGRYPYCWGSDSSGQIGNDAPKESVSTRRRISTNAWSSLDAGGQHTCGIRGDGIRFCWGENGRGQLGLDDTNDRDEPIQRFGEGKWSAVTTGYEHSCGIRSGVLWCWGDNDFGQLGVGSTSRKLLPVRVNN